MIRKMIALFGIVILALIYKAIMPPPPKKCGSNNGPPITAPRVKLSDGRYLAYKENGVPRDQAKHKFVFIHGFDCVRHDVALLTTISPEVMQSLGIYIVSIDRPGYGESDPHPKRTPKTLALDIEELADQLELGSKFYVIGFSMGGQAIWGLLKYIPHRLAGAILLTPVTNYWWGSFPANLTKQAYYEQLVQDQWTLRISHYLPWLTYWWNTQKWFPSSSVATFSEDILFEQDRVLMPIFDEYQSKYRDLVRQQGDYESIHRDLMIGFGVFVSLRDFAFELIQKTRESESEREETKNHCKTTNLLDLDICILNEEEEEENRMIMIKDALVEEEENDRMWNRNRRSTCTTAERKQATFQNLLPEIKHLLVYRQKRKIEGRVE